MGRQDSLFTQKVLQVLKQYSDTGVDFDVLAQHFGTAVDRRRISQTLSNLRDRGQAHSECKCARDGARWFSGPGGTHVDAITPTDLKRIERARQADHAKPLVFYGQGLVAPRAASVWAYARHFQEHRA